MTDAEIRAIAVVLSKVESITADEALLVVRATIDAGGNAVAIYEKAGGA